MHSLDHLKDTHSPAAISRRLENRPRPSLLRDFVYGAIDGTVTTFAVVSGTMGAELSAAIALVLGAANLLADGFSMGVSNYLGTRAEGELRRKTRRAEERQIDAYPSGETEEVRQIFQAKGFKEPVLGQIVETVTSDRELWLETMLVDEHGFGPEQRSPIRSGFATFGAFIVVGSIPLLAYTVAPGDDEVSRATYSASAMLAGLAFFSVGAVKSRFTGEGWLRSGIETLAVGGMAAALAFGIGFALRGLLE